jgi:hypothetical protein
MKCEIFTSIWSALNKWTSSKTRRTAAHGNVVDHITPGILTTGVWTRVNALLSDACLFPGAVLAQNTLRSASDVRISLEFSQASALAISALSIWSARRWVARVGDDWSWLLDRSRSAAGEGIANVALDASAHRRVVDDRTLGLVAASAWAGVSTFFPHASLVAGTFGVDDTLWPAVRRSANVARQTRTRW